MKYPNTVVEIPSNTMGKEGKIVWEDKRFYMSDNHVGYYDMYRRFYHHRQKFCYRIDTLYSVLYAREELSAIL